MFKPCNPFSSLGCLCQPILYIEPCRTTPVLASHQFTKSPDLVPRWRVRISTSAGITTHQAEGSSIRPRSDRTFAIADTSTHPSPPSPPVAKVTSFITSGAGRLTQWNHGWSQSTLQNGCDDRVVVETTARSQAVLKTSEETLSTQVDPSCRPCKHKNIMIS